MSSENERLRAELEATKQQLSQSQAANAAVRPGEVAVPIAEGVPAPGEATPLNGQPLPRSHSVVAMGKAVQDNKMAAGSSSQTCMGILFAIACLAIYYLNGGDSARCSTKLPFFLKVNGFYLPLPLPRPLPLPLTLPPPLALTLTLTLTHATRTLTLSR